MSDRQFVVTVREDVDFSTKTSVSTKIEIPADAQINPIECDVSNLATTAVETLFRVIREREAQNA